MNQLGALKEELEGVEETEGELAAVMQHVDALEAILGTAKKPVRTLYPRISVDSDNLARN